MFERSYKDRSTIESMNDEMKIYSMPSPMVLTMEDILNTIWDDKEKYFLVQQENDDLTLVTGYDALDYGIPESWIKNDLDDYYQQQGQGPSIEGIQDMDEESPRNSPDLCPKAPLKRGSRKKSIIDSNREKNSFMFAKFVSMNNKLENLHDESTPMARKTVQYVVEEDEFENEDMPVMEKKMSEQVKMKQVRKKAKELSLVVAKKKPTVGSSNTVLDMKNCNLCFKMRLR